jgi:LmbE family N-acetylglucosaminyl deacetylase
MPHLRAQGNGIIVFGPHPDDAVLGCSGVMLQAKARGEPVHVVVLTNGDADIPAAGGSARKSADKLGPKDYLAVGRFRDLQSQKGLAALGLKSSALILLAYPDGGLTTIYRKDSSVPFISPYTQKGETYAFGQQDYHTAMHGSPAPYAREAAVDDIAEIIRTLKPRQIYVTTEVDKHPDHKMALLYVRDAIRKTGYRGELYTYLIHGGTGLEWPWQRGLTPYLPFAPPHAKNKQTKFALPWPPPKRIFLTPAQKHLKLLAIRCHKLIMMDPAREAEHEANMESFVKSDEIFWIPLLKQR